MKINLGTFFTWTGAFLILVAAGVFAYGIGDLQEAGVIPGAGVHAYDISSVIPASSWYGTVLQGIVNFNPSPTWLQVVGWVGVHRRRRASSTSASTASSGRPARRRPPTARRPRSAPPDHARTAAS